MNEEVDSLKRMIEEAGGEIECDSSGNVLAVAFPRREAVVEPRYRLHGLPTFPPERELTTYEH